MRNGDWIQTFTGRKFWPLDPQPGDICIEDIAHALALTCRYNGHCRVFYSVAQHSLMMSQADLPGDPRWRLMHDAAEAYISDVPRPVKPHLAGFRDYENKILSVIRDKFRLPEYPKQEIHESDMRLLATEKRDLLKPYPKWGELPEPL